MHELLTGFVGGRLMNEGSGEGHIGVEGHVQPFFEWSEDQPDLYVGEHYRMSTGRNGVGGPLCSGQQDVVKGHQNVVRAIGKDVINTFFVADVPGAGAAKGAFTLRAGPHGCLVVR